jgi:glucosamine-6-phosphate deaminase
MDLLSTIKGSMLESFFPAGWDLAKIDACCSHRPESATERQKHWHAKFEPIACETLADFEIMMGHEIALTFKKTREAKREVCCIFPVGPMGMYRWAVYFLKEWSDATGATLSPDNSGAFQFAMEQALYGPLGKLTVPKKQRNFATKKNLPSYPEKIAELKKKGALTVIIYGIGRVCHIAFWEPHFAAEFKSVADWKKVPYRVGAKLHPLTIEQNAITSFKSRTTLVPCFANTIGPGIFLGADHCIGGADGALGRGMSWQGMSFWMTLRYGADPWIPSTFMPTQPGRLFYLKELAGPLVAECN